MKILVLPGDGIGPEITAATLAVLDRADALFQLELQWQHEEIGLPALRKEGTTLPARVLEAARSSEGVILGPLSTYEYPPRDKGGINPSAEFRTKLDLYANIRPAKSRLGVGLTGKPVDLVIYRENTEGFYADRNMYSGSGEFMPTEDMALAVRRVTAKCCERIARRAFEAAMTRRRKVTAIHKANVFRISDGLYLREVRKVAKEFPVVQLEEIIVDAMAALLLRDPMRFDVIVAENMYGDILRTRRPSFRAAWASAARSTPGMSIASRKRSTGRPPTLPARTGRIPPRSSFRPPCCSNGWPLATARARSPTRQGASTPPSTRP